MRTFGFEMEAAERKTSLLRNSNTCLTKQGRSAVAWATSALIGASSRHHSERPKSTAREAAGPTFTRFEVMSGSTSGVELDGSSRTR